MLYFAYGSNLNHKQMAFRCRDSKYIRRFKLKGYNLCFSHKADNSIYGHANIIKSKNFNVPGGKFFILSRTDFYDSTLIVLHRMFKFFL